MTDDYFIDLYEYLFSQMDHTRSTMSDTFLTTSDHNCQNKYLPGLIVIFIITPGRYYHIFCNKNNFSLSITGTINYFAGLI